MKTKSIIIIAVNFLILIGCQKENKNIEFKNEANAVLTKLDSVNFNNDHKEKTLDSLYYYLTKQKNDSANRNLYFKIASKYFSIDKYDKFLKTAQKVKNLAVKDNDTSHLAKSLYYIGDFFGEKSQLDSAFKYYNKSEKLYVKINDRLNSGKTKLYKAGILFDAGIFSESEIESVQALELLSTTKNTRLIYESYILLGLSLKELNNCKESLEYFNLALQQLEKLDIEKFPKEKIIKSRIACFNNIGRVYEKLQNYKAAITLYNKALQTKNIKQDYPKLYTMLLNNLGYSKMKSGELNNVDKILLESLKIRDSLDITAGIVSSKINIGEYYLYKKDTIKGLNYLKESLLLSKKTKNIQFALESLKLLMVNDSKNHINFTDQYLKLTDSVEEIERITKDKFARIAYETDQVEEKNEILSKRNSTTLITAGIIILLLSGFFIIHRLKSKNAALLFIKEQQEANEKIYQLMLSQQSETELARNEERNRIAMELHDGIVNSIFTTRFNLIQLEPHATDKKEQLVKELEKTENEIRRVSHDLTQNLLFEDKSFPEIITNLVESQRTQNDTKFDVSIDKYIDWSMFSSDKKIHIYRIIQEALQNSNKYSKAERCFVILLKTTDKLTIRIWDNGIGFNIEKVRHGIGLKNITQRTAALNGELKITSETGAGTTIEVLF